MTRSRVLVVCSFSLVRFRSLNRPLILFLPSFIRPLVRKFTRSLFTRPLAGKFQTTLTGRKPECGFSTSTVMVCKFSKSLTVTKKTFYFHLKIWCNILVADCTRPASSGGGPRSRPTSWSSGDKDEDAESSDQYEAGGEQRQGEGNLKRGK